MEEQVTALPPFRATPPPKRFPSDTYKWMKINAAPKMALKLMKICKYFQYQDGFPFLVVKNIKNEKNLWIYWTLDGIEHKTDSLKNLEKALWITDKIDLSSPDCFLSLLNFNFVVNNIRILKLVKQNITFDEFKLLTDGGSVIECELQGTKIHRSGNKRVSIDDIFKCLPIAQWISIGHAHRYYLDVDTTVPSTLEILFLWISDKRYNFPKLYDFMLKNQHIMFCLGFCGFSDAEFKRVKFDDLKKKWTRLFNVIRIHTHIFS